MKHLQLIAVLLLSNYVFAQVKVENTTVEGNPKLTYLSPSKIQMGETVLSVEATRAYLKKFPKSYELYNKGRSNRTLGSVFMIVGGGIIVGNAISNLSIANQNNSEDDIINGNAKEGTPVPYIVGLGLVGASIPILSAGKKNIQKSVDMYNSKYAGGKSVTLNLINNTQGVGLSLRF